MMKMKHFSLDQISSEINPNSHVLKMRSSAATSSHGHIVMPKPSLCFLLNEMDLNPARVIMAEFIGTFLLVFCVCGIKASTRLASDNAGLLEYAATAGMSIIVVVFIFGPISGAHVNPAVTIAFATLGHFSWSKVPLYILAQTLGSLLASYAGEAIYGIKADLVTTRPVHGISSAFWSEFVATLMVMFLCAALAHQAQYVGPASGLVIGVVIGLAVLITGPVSGGSLNPARSLGPAIVSGNFQGIWIYMTAPVIGAAIGGQMYRFLYLRGQPCTHNTNIMNDSLAFTVGREEDG